MNFSDQYTTDAFDMDKSKKLISYDAYAIGDMIDQLIKQIEHTRLSLTK